MICKGMKYLIYERILKFRKVAFAYKSWKCLIENKDEKGKYGVRLIVTDAKIKTKYIYHALAILFDKKGTYPLL